MLMSTYKEDAARYIANVVNRGPCYLPSYKKYADLAATPTATRRLSQEGFTPVNEEQRDLSWGWSSSNSYYDSFWDYLARIR